MGASLPGRKYKYTAEFNKSEFLQLVFVPWFHILLVKSFTATAH